MHYKSFWRPPCDGRGPTFKWQPRAEKRVMGAWKCRERRVAEGLCRLSCFQPVSMWWVFWAFGWRTWVRHVTGSKPWQELFRKVSALFLVTKHQHTRAHQSPDAEKKSEDQKLYPLVAVYVTMERSTMLLMGKSTFSMSMASIAFCMFTRSGKVPSADIFFYEATGAFGRISMSSVRPRSDGNGRSVLM